MVNSKCVTKTDSTKRELEAHGDILFPIACYDEDLSIEKVGVHWHEELEFIHVYEGKSKLHIDKTEVNLTAGSAIFINSGHLHSAYGNAKIKSLVFHHSLIGSENSIFYQEVIFPLLDNDKLSYLVLSDKEEWERNVTKNMMLAYDVINTESYDYENEARFHITRALRQLNENIKINQKINSHDGITYNRIKKVLRYIDDNLSEELNNDKLSKLIAVSESVLLKSFKQTIGLSPMQYVLKKRIDRARYLIITTDKKISDIASECGFNDMSYFSKIFKRNFNVSPTEYKIERQE
ncbi:MAG: AraC family transcriptional regulator [Spirochaetales bacterium]|nr:AraC family transcriptional regulator [Spirochaetales bacterium]